METTEYDLYDLLIGDDDISSIGDGSVTGAITTLDTSILNLCKVKAVNGSITDIGGGSTKSQTITIPTIPSGYSWLFIPNNTGWGTLSGVSVSGTSLTLTFLNPSSNTHSVTWGGVLVYYPSTWNI